MSHVPHPLFRVLDSLSCVLSVPASGVDVRSGGTLDEFGRRPSAPSPMGPLLGRGVECLVGDIEARPDRRRLPSRKVVPLPIGGLAAGSPPSFSARRSPGAPTSPPAGTPGRARPGPGDGQHPPRLAVRVHHLGPHPRLGRAAARQPLRQGRRPAAAPARTPRAHAGPGPHAEERARPAALLPPAQGPPPQRGRRAARPRPAAPQTARSCTPCSARPAPRGTGQPRPRPVTPNTPEALRTAKKAKISGVRGKGGGRTALADYLEHERPADAGLAEGQ